MTALTLAACSGEGTTATTDDQAQTTSTTSTTVASTPPAGRTPVIADYSPTVSDVGGLIYLLSRPEIEVIAITLPATGEAGCDLGLQVTVGILSMMNQEEIPVACDPELPDDAEEWPAEFLEGSLNLLSGLPKLGPDGSQTGPELLAEAVQQSDRPVVIWAVAPLTNVASALTNHPGIISNIERVVIMGGAVDVPGNVFDAPSEWNFFIDASAAASVISSGVPVTLVPLDATNDVPVPGWFPNALSRAEQSDQTVYLTRAVETFGTATSGFYYMWDELAAAVTADAVDVVVEETPITVVVGGPSSGQTTRDTSGSSLVVVTGVQQPDDFYSDYISTVAGAPYVRAQATETERSYLLAVSDSLEEFGMALAATFAPGSPFESDVYDGEAVVAAFEPIFEGMQISLDEISNLDPPETLSSLHIGYLDELRGDLGVADEFLAGMRSAETWEEAGEVFDLLSTGTACEAIADEAFFLGVTADFPCNP